MVTLTFGSLNIQGVTDWKWAINDAAMVETSWSNSGWTSNRSSPWYWVPITPEGKMRPMSDSSGNVTSNSDEDCHANMVSPPRQKHFIDLKHQTMLDSVMEESILNLRRKTVPIPNLLDTAMSLRKSPPTSWHVVQDDVDDWVMDQLANSSDDLGSMIKSYENMEEKLMSEMSESQSSYGSVSNQPSVNEPIPEENTFQKANLFWSFLTYQPELDS